MHPPSHSYQRRVISSNERPVFHRIPSRIMEVISRRWYEWLDRGPPLCGCGVGSRPPIRNRFFLLTLLQSGFAPQLTSLRSTVTSEQLSSSLVSLCVRAMLSADRGTAAARAQSLNFWHSSSQVIGRSAEPGTLEPSRSMRRPSRITTSTFPSGSFDVQL